MENLRSLFNDFEQLLYRAKALSSSSYVDPSFQIWKSDAEDKLITVLGAESARVKQFKKLPFYYTLFEKPIKGISDSFIQHQNQFKSDLDVAVGIVRSCYGELKSGIELQTNKATALNMEEIESQKKSPLPTLPDPDQPLSLNEACGFLKLAPQTIYGYTSRNEIPHFKKGKKLYFYKSELVNWLKSEKPSNDN